MTDLYDEMKREMSESDDDPTPLATALAKLAAIRKLAQANNHPGVNIGAHALANEILKVLNEQP